MNIEQFTNVNNWLKPILSTALHDIYNEINNLFFVSESVLWNYNNKNPEILQQDFFTIINQIKGKQFLFNNIFNEKQMELSELQKSIGPLTIIKYDINYFIPINIFCLLLLLIYENSMIYENNTISLFIKPKFVNDFKDLSLPNEKKFWAIKLLIYFFHQYKYSYQLNDNQLIIMNI
jgi:hypothetical protein